MWLLDCRCLGWTERFWLVVEFASWGSVGLRSFRDLTVGTLWCGCWIGLSCLGLVVISVCSVGGWVGVVGALCFWIGLLFVVVAADLVCGCYSMVSSCVFSGCHLVGFVLRWFGLVYCVLQGVWIWRGGVWLISWLRWLLVVRLLMAKFVSLGCVDCWELGFKARFNC